MGNNPVTTAALIEEMTDLTALASFPNPAYTCKQFSSYDRAAKSPTENVQAVAAALRLGGFEVLLRIDVGGTDLRAAMQARHFSPYPAGTRRS